MLRAKLPLRALNLRVKRPQHSWTREERYLLCCLRRFFDLDYAEITRVFNEIYAAKLQREGLPDGLKKSTIHTQWEDLGRRLHEDWELVHRDVPFDQGSNIFHDLFQQIRDAAASLQIPLVARARDLDVSRFGEVPSKRRTQPAQPKQTAPAAGQPTRVARTGLRQQTVSRSIRDRIAQQRPSTSPQTTPVSKPQQNLHVITDPIEHIKSYGLNRQEAYPKPTPATQPPLLWRFSNDESVGINSKWGYVAYAFTTKLGSIPTPEERLEEFPAWVWSHVNKKRIPSPFISTSMDPVIPIHRALRNPEHAIVSLINPSQIPPNHIFHMRELMLQYQFKTDNYLGTKEYIIWGSISRNAILMSFRVEELLTITSEHPDINEALQLDVISGYWACKTYLYRKLAAKSFPSDFQVGKTIGKLLKLLCLQREYVDDVAAAFNISWGFSKDTTHFLRGAGAGYDEIAGVEPDVSSPPSSNRTSETIFTDSAEKDSVQTDSSTDHRKMNDKEQQKNRAFGEDTVGEFFGHVRTLHHEDDDSLVIVSSTTRPAAPPNPGGTVRSTEKRPASLPLPMESKFPKTDSSVGISRNRTVATRHITLFDPHASSWVPVQDSAEPEQGQTETKTTQSQERGDNEEAEVLPSIEDTNSYKVITPGTPMRFKKSHSRSCSLESESTICNDTLDHFGRERPHLN